MNINFKIDIEGFDIENLMKELSNNGGVNINIYTMHPIGTINNNLNAKKEALDVIVEDVDAVHIIDKTLKFDERTAIAVKMREEGSSWTEIGMALGVSKRTAERRLRKYHEKIGNNKHTKGKNSVSNTQEEVKFEEFNGFHNKQLYDAAYQWIYNTDQVVFPVEEFVSALKNAVNKGGFNPEGLKLIKFNENINQWSEKILILIQKALGNSVCLGNYEKHSSGLKSLVVINRKKLPSLKDASKLFKKKIKSYVAEYRHEFDE